MGFHGWGEASPPSRNKYWPRNATDMIFSIGTTQGHSLAPAQPEASPYLYLFEQGLTIYGRQWILRQNEQNAHNGEVRRQSISGYETDVLSPPF